MKDLVMRVNSKPLKKEPMPDEVKAYIISRVREDVHRLEVMMQRDLSHWLK